MRERESHDLTRQRRKTGLVSYHATMVSCRPFARVRTVLFMLWFPPYKNISTFRGLEVAIIFTFAYSGQFILARLCITFCSSHICVIPFLWFFSPTFMIIHTEQMVYLFAHIRQHQANGLFAGSNKTKSTCGLSPRLPHGIFC